MEEEVEVEEEERWRRRWRWMRRWRWTSVRRRTPTDHHLVFFCRTSVLLLALTSVISPESGVSSLESLNHQLGPQDQILGIRCISV